MIVFVFPTSSKTYVSNIELNKVFDLLKKNKTDTWENVIQCYSDKELADESPDANVYAVINSINRTANIQHVAMTDPVLFKF